MAGMLNDMVGAAGCDGGGNAMMMGVNKMFGEGRTQQQQQQPGMGFAPGQQHDVDELAVMGGEDWASDFQRQQLHGHGPMPMHPQEDWAAEMMAQQQQQQQQVAMQAQQGAAWADEFQQQQQQQPQNWAEEFAQDEVQTFGVVGEEAASIEQKTEACKSKFHDETTRNQTWADEFGPQQDEDWVSQYLQGGDQAGDWANQFAAEGGEEWANQVKGMMAENGWADEYAQKVDSKEYPFEEDNPFMFHENPFDEGMELKAAGCLAQAVLAFEATVRKDETHQEGWKQLGLTQADNEKDKHAVCALHQAKQLTPADHEVLMQLGVSLTNEGLRDEATDTFREWISRHPVHGEFAAKALAITGMADGVEELSNQMMTDYFTRQDKETARVIQVYEQVLQNAPDPELHGALGVLHHMARDYPAAVRHYSALVKFPEKSQDSKLWNRLGAIMANGGMHADALNSYNRALDINPGFVRAYYNIGVSHSQMEHHDAAAQSYLKALEIQTGGSSPKPSGAGTGIGMEIWDALRRSFSMMGRQDLYDKTWKADLSLFSDMMGQ